MTAVEFEAVWKHYDRGKAEWAALAGVDLRIARGEAVAVVGASGCGKTTLLNLAAGLDHPTRGQVRLMGQPLEAMGPAQLARHRRRHVGFVFQVLNLLPALTAAENIELPLAINRVGSADRRRRCRALLEAADLAELGERRPDELSLGQQQRVAVLRAMAHRPAVLLMDEPTSALDSPHADQLMRLVAALVRDEQVAVVVATHDHRIADHFSRRIQLFDGRIVQEGPDGD